MPSDWASPLAAATPTRRPVKSPGPDVDGDDPESAGARSTWASRWATVGVKRLDVAATAVSAELGLARRRRVRTATPTVSVAVSMATMVTLSLPAAPTVAPSTRRQRRRHPVAARPAQRPATTVDGRRDRAASSSGTASVTSSGLVAQRRGGHVAPLDHGHGVLLDQLGQGQIGHLGHRAGAVDVGVDQPGHRAPGHSGTGARARRWGSSPAGHPERGGEPLGEDRLARAEAADEQHDVAGLGTAGPGDPPAARVAAGWRGRVFTGLFDVWGRPDQPLGPHQVGPHLGHGLAAGAQDVGRVVGGDEVGRPPVRRRGPAARGCPGALEEELGGEVAEVTITTGAIRAICSLEIRAAGLDLVGRGIAVAAAAGT